jgi:hypothetical protein
MFCSAAGNTGIVHFAGPIQPSELEDIKVSSYFPLTFAFAARTTPPTLLNRNHIEDGIGNSCFLNGKRYNLVGIQVCSPLHKGYKLPGETQVPVAECVLTFSPSGMDSQTMSGILLCLPIYESNTPAYDAYLEQIVTDPDISCGYENQVGKTYEGTDQKTIKDSTLRKCVKACCDDAQCLAYTFGGGTCHIKHTIPNLLSTGDATVSGKIRRDLPKSCATTSANSLVASLETLFYRPDGSTTHSILAYKTCFETINRVRSQSNSLYVMVFPKGIHMRPASYQQLVLRANGWLPPYGVPEIIRNGERTLLRYRMENGRKVPTDDSGSGRLYTTTLSTCTDEFRDRFEYLLLPPRTDTRAPSGSSGSSGSGSDQGSCRRLTTEQYKCVPFREGTDLSGNVVIPRGTTLAEVLKKQKEAKNATQGGGQGTQIPEGLSAGEIEGIIGGSIGGIILLYVVYRGVTYLFNRPS